MDRILSAIVLVVTALSLAGSASASSVPLTKVDTGSNKLNHEITAFYKCVSDTGKDPPAISIVDKCFQINVGGGLKDLAP